MVVAIYLSTYLTDYPAVSGTAPFLNKVNDYIIHLYFSFSILHAFPPPLSISIKLDMTSIRQ
jgi:hypothetical protein